MYISVESGKDNISFLQDEWSSSLNEDINFKMVVKGFKNAKIISVSTFQAVQTVK